MFIGHPQADRPATSHVQVPEPVAQRLLEVYADGRVFERVSLARHLQDSAQFSQPVVYPFERELLAVLLLEPVLDLLGPLPATRLQAFLKFGQGFARDLRRSPTAMSAREQTGHTTGLERFDPVEKLTAADAHLLRELRRAELAAGG